MIAFTHVKKFILEDVSFYLPAGTVAGLIGASGSGKTTFLKLCCGLLSPAKGQVYTLRQNPVSERKVLGRVLGAYFTDIPVLYGEDTVYENFRTIQLIHQMSEESFSRTYAELSQRLGFRAYEQVRVKELSLGQRKRAELGAVLMPHPRLLLFDEPTNGLDTEAKEAFQKIIAERAENGASILLTSHDMGEISQMCSRIALLEKGKLLYYGGREALQRRYKPIERLELNLCGRLPDLEDLPAEKYVIDGNHLILYYHAGHVTAAEILGLILPQTEVSEITVHKPELREVILQVMDTHRRSTAADFHPAQEERKTSL